MKILRVQDKYNSSKIWVIKITACGHYYMNQEICGSLFYNKFSKTTKRYLKQVGVIGKGWTVLN
jgi:hypothetical protein